MRRTRGEIGRFFLFAVECFAVEAWPGLFPGVVLLVAGLALAVELFAVDLGGEGFAGALSAGAEFSCALFSGPADVLAGGVAGLSDLTGAVGVGALGTGEVGADEDGVEGDDCRAKAGDAEYALEPGTLSNPHHNASPSTHPIKLQRMNLSRTTFSIFARRRDCQNLQIPEPVFTRLLSLRTFYLRKLAPITERSSSARLRTTSFWK